MGFIIGKNLGGFQILRFFVYFSIPISSYGVIQAIGFDPIAWSQYAVFATLGNVNFASSFFAMQSVAAASLALISKKRNQDFSTVIMLIFLSLSNAALTIYTESIQGPILIAFALIICLFSLLSSKTRSKVPSIVFCASVSIVGLLIALGSLGRGFLGRYLYQETLLYRTDYWRAGLSMIADSPIFGKGPDSYGEWYRRSRDFIATTRTNPDRTANTAHNVFIDMGVSAGALAGLALFFIFLVPVAVGLRKVLNKSEFRLEFQAIWILVFMYLLQALISINQIAISSWGWLMVGLLWGMNQLESSGELKSRIQGARSSKKSTQNLNDINDIERIQRLGVTGTQNSTPGEYLISVVMGFLGVLLVVPALKADMQFYSALNSGNLGKMKIISNQFGSNQAHAEETLFRMGSEPNSVRKEFALQTLNRYPNSVYTLRVLYDLTELGDPNHIAAVRKLKSLDPLNPNLTSLK